MQSFSNGNKCISSNEIIHGNTPLLPLNITNYLSNWGFIPQKTANTCQCLGFQLEPPYIKDRHTISNCFQIESCSNKTHSTKMDLLPYLT